MPQTLLLSSTSSVTRALEEAHPVSEEASHEGTTAPTTVHGAASCSSTGLKDGLSPADPDRIAVVRPLLGAAYSWIAPVTPGELGHSGANVLSRCGLRIFRNGSLGRSFEWAVLLTELPGELLRTSTSVAFSGWNPAWRNPGVPAMACLAELATDIKRVHLPRVPAELITWFHHQPGAVAKDRPIPHHQLHRIEFVCSGSNGRTRFGAPLMVKVAPEELEMAAGGLVEL